LTSKGEKTVKAGMDKASALLIDTIKGQSRKEGPMVFRNMLRSQFQSQLIIIQGYAAPSAKMVLVRSGGYSRIEYDLVLSLRATVKNSSALRFL
jgi:hypothetical protein